MPIPAVGTVAQELYDDLAPLAYDDAAHGYALLALCGALGLMLQPVSDLVRDTVNGPGWSEILDVDRCPPSALPFLGQFLGVTVNPALSTADQRNQIRAPVGFGRGTLAAMRAAAKATLTGSKTVIIRERTTDAYHFEVITYTDQTPDSAATLAALIGQKPAGLVMDYQVHDGQDWFDVNSNYPSWQAVMDHYSTWGDVRADEPAGP